MKLKEAMNNIGAHKFMNPATSLNIQIVQPKTKQAEDPLQGIEFEKAKKANKEQKKIDIEKYNEKETEVLNNHFDNEINVADNALKQIIKKHKKIKSINL